VRSARFAAAAVPVTQFRSVRHKRLVPIYDQGADIVWKGELYHGLGSCTGNAAAGALSTRPFQHRYRSERTAVGFYAAATAMDDFSGSFPPDDLGSSGLGVARALLARRLITRYEHAFSFEAALTALQDRPVIAGINWYDSFDRPDSQGVIRISPGASIRGGHEIELAELILATEGQLRPFDLIGIPNSWGTGYGRDGWVWMPVETFDRLLHESGDVTILLG
jgi:hypothetical protein